MSELRRFLEDSKLDEKDVAPMLQVSRWLFFLQRVTVHLY